MGAKKELFRAKIKGKKLFGRGAFDMKYAIACYMKLLFDLGKNLKNYNFGLMITSDEEVGGENGVKKLLKEGFRSKVAFVPDCGKNWNFMKKAKGVWHFSVEAEGKSAHGSRPWLGENAIEKLFEFLKEAKKIFPKEPCHKKHHWHETFNIGKIEGGRATNQVPDFAKANIDIRFTSMEKFKKIKKYLNQLAKKYKISFENLSFCEPFECDFQNPYFKIFKKIAKEKFKIKTGKYFSHGTNDGRFFAKKKIPTIILRPKGSGSHSDKEWIDIEDLEKFYLVLKEFTIKVAKK